MPETACRDMATPLPEQGPPSMAANRFPRPARARRKRSDLRGAALCARKLLQSNEPAGARSPDPRGRKAPRPDGTVPSCLQLAAYSNRSAIERPGQLCTRGNSSPRAMISASASASSVNRPRTAASVAEMSGQPDIGAVVPAPRTRTGCQRNLPVPGRARACAAGQTARRNGPRSGRPPATGRSARPGSSLRISACSCAP